MIITKGEFLKTKEVVNYITFLVDAFQTKFKLKDEINKYNWPDNSKGLNFEKTYTKIKELRDGLANALSDKDSAATLELCEDILKWGGVGVATKNINKLKKLVEEKKFLTTLLTAREVIQSDSTEKNAFPVPCNSGFSKIYTCLYGKFIIYDSRVAASMCFMASKCFENENPIQLGKAAYQAKVNRNPGKAFPMLTGNDKKYLESNIKASWIVEEMANQYNPHNFPTEKLIFAYQTAFFVLGKDLGELEKRF